MVWSYCYQGDLFWSQLDDFTSNDIESHFLLLQDYTIREGMFKGVTINITKSEFINEGIHKRGILKRQRNSTIPRHRNKLGIKTHKKKVQELTSDEENHLKRQKNEAEEERKKLFIVQTKQPLRNMQQMQQEHNALIAQQEEQNKLAELEKERLEKERLELASQNRDNMRGSLESSFKRIKKEQAQIERMKKVEKEKQEKDLREQNKMTKEQKEWEQQQREKRLKAQRDLIEIERREKEEKERKERERLARVEREIREKREREFREREREEREREEREREERNRVVERNRFQPTVEPVWQYHTQEGHWEKFDEFSTVLLESCYSEKSTVMTVELDDYDANLDKMIAIHTRTKYRYPIRRLGGADPFDQLSERKKTLLADEGVNISNDRKLAFMKLIFSKLDPNFIEKTLIKHHWRLDNALDDLFDAEELRAQKEEDERERLARLRAEEERKEREELEHQKKLQSEKNIISRLQLEFPTFALDMIKDILTSSGWVLEEAYEMLRSIKASEDEEIEKKRLMDELIEFQRQIKLKEEEEKRLQEMNEKKVETIVESAENWNDIISKFELNVDHPIDMDDEATRLKRDQLIMNETLEERKVIVKTIHELYEFIDEAAIQEAFEEVGWETTLAMPKMEENNISHFKAKMSKRFPLVPEDYIEYIVGHLYPDEPQVVSALEQIDDLFAQIRLVQKSIDNATTRAETARLRKKEAEEERDAASLARDRIDKIRSENEKGLASLKGEDRLFMEGALAMLTQSETSYFEKRIYRSDTEIAACDRHLDDLNTRMADLVRQQFEIKNPNWIKVQTAKLESKANLNAEERLRMFEDKFLAWKDQKRVQNDQDTVAKQQIIIQKVQDTLGIENYGKLVSKIGSLPHKGNNNSSVKI